MKTKQSSTESSAEFDVASYREVLEGVKAEVQRLGMRVETIVESIEKLQASLDKVAISKVQPDDEHSTSEERKTETAPDDMNSRSCPCLSTEMELRSTEQDISNRILEKLDDLILVTQGFNKNLTPMNKYVRAKLACLRLDCFRLLCHAINDPKFEEQWVRWEIPIEYNQRDGTSRRRLPQPSPSWKKTTSFINILSEVDLDELSNGNLGQSDLKWLQDERIGFLESAGDILGRENWDESYHFLAETLLQDRYANQRRKVRSIFKYVTGVEIEDMDRDAWLFEL